MRRFAFTPGGEQTLPLFVETIGIVIERKMVRTEGYPFFHWLQTTRGEGSFTVNGSTFALPVNSGVLLYAGTPHQYEASTELWETAYLTFGGPSVAEMLHTLKLQEGVPVRWDADAPLTGLLRDMLDRLETEPDLFGLNASADAYRFLIALRHYGRFDNRTDIAHGSERLRPLLEWLELHYADAEIGLAEMSGVLDVPVSTLNLWFHHTFGLSPYAYLVQLRLRKAKELLIGASDVTVKEIAERVGFRDASHFVATFRRKTGLPPRQFRRLYE
ncbi:helix-turn-helix domain-containing protein [Cohnella massiliensis]|uniref:helix-turn-helix domain-containing protein n=1 Tax=Cohnella massiliensis TaxID=1816691 RepID=UPI0009BBF968|nr:AraC family transcriptional regulator [Cohnella massiliensis]